jgi:alpha-glucosidase
VLAFTRSFDGETLLAAFNLSAQAVDVELPDLGELVAVDADSLLQGTLQGRRLHLPAYAALFARVG